MKKETRARAFTAEHLLRARGNAFLETIPVMPSWEGVGLESGHSHSTVPSILIPRNVGGAQEGILYAGNLEAFLG